MGVVIPGAGRLFLHESRCMAKLPKVPCFITETPDADLGSGNESVATAHQEARYGVSTASE